MSRLLRYTLRILVDPGTIQSDGRLFNDLNELQFCLKEWDSPCGVSLLFPEYALGNSKAQLSLFRHIRFKGLAVVQNPVPEVMSAFAEAPGTQAEVQALASMAIAGDTDIVFSSQLAAQPEVVSGFRKLHMEVLNEQDVRRSVEVFVRGHEIPWAFGHSIWQWPWTVFYPQIESDISVMEQLRALAGQVGASPELQEYIRSLCLNRWSAIAYTRDKLLFFVIQRRAAKRRGEKLQEFTFELTYYLLNLA